MCQRLLRLAAVCVGAALAIDTANAQPASRLSDSTRRFVSVAEPSVVLSHVTVIDGTGAAPKTDQTIVIEQGKIAQVGPAASVPAPAGARVMDLHGQTVIPG